MNSLQNSKKNLKTHRWPEHQLGFLFDRWKDFLIGIGRHVGADGNVALFGFAVFALGVPGARLAALGLVLRTIDASLLARARIQEVAGRRGGSGRDAAVRHGRMEFPVVASQFLHDFVTDAVPRPDFKSNHRFPS